MIHVACNDSMKSRVFHLLHLFLLFLIFLSFFALSISQAYDRERRLFSLPRAQYLDVLRITKEPDAQLELLMPLPPYNQTSWPATAVDDGLRSLSASFLSSP